MSYWFLFLSAFGAATVLPFYSEVTLLAMLNMDYPALALWWVATLGNTLGALLNWLLGLYATRFAGKRWFPFKPDALQRGQRWFQRYGVWSLLLAWMPLGGDALTFVAGVMRVRWWIFLPLVALGKAARYAVVIALYNGAI
ncbi:MAG: DedA family protein [Pseudomonadales bacterium]|nr:DedA family protein [Gammaproteobacteria bacterium]NNL56668.1 DedA family protein [Pseudomonadales bacterium]